MRKSLVIVALILIFCSGIGAQSLRGLYENPVIKKNLHKLPVTLKSTQGVLLSLPFFDDFSASDVFPDPSKWSDHYAFINNSFAVDPISVGVATLDAIDENGDVYSLTNRAASSDKLTSQSLDLSPYKNTGKTVRLSFFYQCGGRGEVPERNDSLLVEYYQPSRDRWLNAWFANMDEPSEFLQEILEVPDSLYVAGFRFRFRNYTSISVNDVSGGEGALSNADCWNIDYVRLDTNSLQSHQIINDVAITDIPRKMLDLYEAIPWSHLNLASPVIGRNSMNYGIRIMMEPGDIANIGRSYYTKDMNTGYRENYELFYEEFPTDSLIQRSDPFFAPFVQRDDSKSGAIRVSAFLDTPADQVKSNDTSRITIEFKDAYVYDDGSPEYGFGIEGPSMNGALLAVKFRLFSPDTLQAVDMFFNKARDNFNAGLKFRLCVWKDAGGKPGDLLYMSDEEFSPVFGPQMPEFRRYVIDSAMYVTDSIIYVGWKQLTDEFLNIGYDVNRNNLNRTFVNLAGDWINPGGSLLPGTVMMRAVVGSRDVITGVPENHDISEIKVYPNPASDYISVLSGETITGIVLTDISGRMVLKRTGSIDRIDVSSFAPGLYVLTVNTGKAASYIQKIIIRH
jgi:hypothetical protein